MKSYIRLLALAACFAMQSYAGQAQALLGIGAPGVINLPDTVQYGDTLRNMAVYVVNRGTIAAGSLFVSLVADPNNLGSPINIGTLDLSTTTLFPGDSIYVPLDYFVVTPSNSNNGSNVMVIWPTAPGTQPSDSARDDYWVDSPTNLVASTERHELKLYPNPSSGVFFLERSGTLPASMHVRIFSIDGKMLMRRGLTQGEAIDLTSLSNGLYLYRMEANEEFLGSGKVLIVR